MLVFFFSLTIHVSNLLGNCASFNYQLSVLTVTTCIFWIFLQSTNSNFESEIFSTSLVIFSNHKLANISYAQIELSNIDLLLLREVPVKIGKSPHPRFGLLCEIGAVSTDIYSPRWSLTIAIAFNVFILANDRTVNHEYR